MTLSRDFCLFTFHPKHVIRYYRPQDSAIVKIYHIDNISLEVRKTFQAQYQNDRHTRLSATKKFQGHPRS